MRLRPATADDTGQIASIWGRPDNAAFLPPPEDGQIEQAVETGNLLVIDGNGQVAGFALLVEWMPLVMGVEAIAVCERGKGIGTRLLDGVLSHVFRDRGAHRLGLDATVDNEAALALYAKAGFTREGIFRECWQRDDGVWVDCVFLSLLSHEFFR